MYKKLLLVLSIFIIGCTSDNSSFKDQELSGKLNNKAWKANHVEGETFDFGTHKKISYSIYSEPCEKFECISIKTPSLNISNLDPEKSEGEFTLQNNITIFYPSNKNILITDGEYKKTDVNGKTELKLRFHLDDGNFVNGVISY